MSAYRWKRYKIFLPHTLTPTPTPTPTAHYYFSLHAQFSYNSCTRTTRRRPSLRPLSQAPEPACWPWASKKCLLTC